MALEFGEQIAHLAVGGGVVLVGRILFDWLKPKSNGVVCPLDRAKTIEKITWLKDVHDKNDPDGLPLWYIPRSMDESMKKVAEATAKQNSILAEIKGLLANNGIKLDTIIRNGRK